MKSIVWSVASYGWTLKKQNKKITTAFERKENYEGIIASMDDQ